MSSSLEADNFKNDRMTCYVDTLLMYQIMLDHLPVVRYSSFASTRRVPREYIDKILRSRDLPKWSKVDGVNLMMIVAHGRFDRSLCPIASRRFKGRCELHSAIAELDNSCIVSIV